MNSETLKKGIELEKLINKTSDAITNLKKLRQSITNKKPLHVAEGHFDDGMYNFSVSQYKDSSGISADLSRYFGNKELLDTIIDKLEEQLKSFELLFNGL